MNDFTLNDIFCLFVVKCIINILKVLIDNHLEHSYISRSNVLQSIRMSHFTAKYVTAAINIEILFSEIIISFRPVCPSIWCTYLSSFDTKIGF